MDEGTQTLNKTVFVNKIFFAVFLAVKISRCDGGLQSERCQNMVTIIHLLWLYSFK